MSRLEELIAAMPKIDHGPIDKAAYARAYRDLVQYLRSSAKTPGPDSETYYTKGKDGAYWEGLPDAEFARELSYACQDLNDTGLGDDLDKWMPFQVMMGDAANRITRILSAIEAPSEGEEEPAAYGVYLTDGRFMDIASDSREVAEEMALIHYEDGEFAIRPLYTRPSPATPSEVTEEMVERAAKAMASKDGNLRNWQLYVPDARAALTAALKGTDDV